MPANNEMEILMQQKMEEFRIEPSPADWQAIYERLHPKKDRRFFWWWFPLMAGLLFGGYRIATHNQSLIPGTTAITAALPAKKSPASAITGIAEKQSHLTQDQLSPSVVTTRPAIEKSKPSAISPVQLPIDDEPTNSPDEVKQSRSAFSKKSTHNVEGSASVPSSDIIPGTDNGSPAGIKASSNSLVPVEKFPATTGNNTSEQNQNQNAAVIQTSNNGNEFKLIQEEKTETTSSHKEPLKDSTLTLAPSIEQSLKKNSIPNLSNHAEKGWYLGAYAEIGLNKPTEPIGLAKAADMNSFPGSVSITTTSQESSDKGLHYAFGLALERKLKKMSFSFGLGIQSNTWSSTSTTYKDSIVAGNFFTRIQISNNSSNYTHIAMELPVMLNFRIAGKKHSSYWLNTGLNNAITLKLDQKTDVSMLQGNASYSQDNSLTSKASSYQPQFRIGFTYENTQDRYHWQLTPFMQYGLSSMVKSGSPDTHLLHFGVQTRYYFWKLK